MTSTAGYSGKALFLKLGIKEGMQIGVIEAPAHHDSLMAGAPPCIWHHVDVPAVLPDNLDMVQLFCANQAALHMMHETALAKIAEKGMLWVSWPKKSSKLFVDLIEDSIRATILPGGIWVDVKVCAVDKDWSGLKFLRRKASQ